MKKSVRPRFVVKRLLTLGLTFSLGVAGTLTLFGSIMGNFNLPAEARPMTEVQGMSAFTQMVEEAFDFSDEELDMEPVATEPQPQIMNIGTEYTLKNGDLLGYYQLPETEQQVVYFNQDKILVLPNAQRDEAKNLTYRLYQYLKDGGSARNIRPGIENNNVVVRAGEQVILTVNEALVKAQAKNTKQTRQELALSITNQLRTQLGADVIRHDSSLTASRGAARTTSGNKNMHASGVLRTGLASWYGPGFHGRTAADGSTFNMYAYTAAHKTLPLGTYVRVLNNDNGKSVIVKITDRGPYVGERVLDLSKRAAEDLDITDDGVAKVTYEVMVAEGNLG